MNRRDSSVVFNPHGIALLEVLIGLLLLSLGFAALLRWQTGLWQQADLSRDRARATRLVQADLERLRWFASIAGSTAPAGGVTPANAEPSWSGIVASGPIDSAGADGEPPLTLQRQVIVGPSAALKAIASTARWTDRRGLNHQLSVSALVDAQDPRWSAWLTLAPGTRTGGARTLQPALPPQAQDLGNGTSAWRPLADQATVWLFDNRSTQITLACTAPVARATALIRPSDLSACVALAGWPLTGTVRFATTSASVDARMAENPLGPALPLGLQITLSEPAAAATPTWTCLNDAPTTGPSAPTSVAPAGTQTSVRYACLIHTGSPTVRWSGRLDLVPIGWLLARNAADIDPVRFRICRYSADQNGNGVIDNAEHPASYSRVLTPLFDQNFLVVRATASCPVEALGVRDGADDSTVAHQP